MLDLVLLKTITSYTVHPDRLRYMRCWGCGKRRFFALWWEGYQQNYPSPGIGVDRWGYFCASCAVIIASMRLDNMRFASDTVRITALDEALDQFDCEKKDDTPGSVYARIEALQKSIENDQQTNGY